MRTLKQKTTVFQLIQLRSAIRLEAAGMKGSRGSATAFTRRLLEVGSNVPREALIAQLTEFIENAKAAGANLTTELSLQIDDSRGNPMYKVRGGQLYGVFHGKRGHESELSKLSGELDLVNRNPREEKRLLYTAHELKELFPEAFEKALKEYADSLSDIPWQDEAMDSLKAVFEKSGIKLTDWSIGSYNPSYVRFDMGEAGELSGKRAFAWLENNLLSKLRMPWTGKRRTETRRYRSGYRPGEVESCPLTGYCFDDDLIKALVDEVRSGSTLKEAYNNLADVTRKQFEAEWEYATSEEGFLGTSEANHYEYDRHGNQV